MNSSLMPEAGVHPSNCRISRTPTTPKNRRAAPRIRLRLLKSEVADESIAQTLFKLIDTLDDDDDVQTVWGNYEIPDAVMEKLG